MLCLAALYYSVYMWVGSQMHMRHNVPPPVIVEQGEVYDYDEIYSEIKVPSTYQGTCQDQRQFVLAMLMHYNNWRHIQKSNTMKLDTMQTISKKWVCVE